MLKWFENLSSVDKVFIGALYSVVMLFLYAATHSNWRKFFSKRGISYGWTQALLRIAFALLWPISLVCWIVVAIIAVIWKSVADYRKTGQVRRPPGWM